MKMFLIGYALVFCGFVGSAQAQVINKTKQLPEPVSKVSKEIQQQVMRLEEQASRISIYKVTPSLNEKDMMIEYALNEGLVESVEEFEERWVGSDDSAWDGDSLAFGLDNLAGAKSYVRNVIEQSYEDGDQSDEAGSKFAKSFFNVKYAFQYLNHNSKSIKVGVTSNGAVQCGFTFQALLIIDMEEGFIYEIVMESSGC